MRLIDADALLSIMVERKCPGPSGEDNSKERIRHMQWLADYWAIKDAPTIEERKKGKWIHGREVCREYMGITLMIVQYSHWECSVCGYRTENEPIWKYCPNCGARMKGADDE